eukprot:3641773-Pleurochrysis_carterae.AAC.1
MAARRRATTCRACAATRAKQTRARKKQRKTSCHALLMRRGRQGPARASALAHGLCPQCAMM